MLPVAVLAAISFWSALSAEYSVQSNPFQCKSANLIGNEAARVLGCVEKILDLTVYQHARSYRLRCIKSQSHWVVLCYNSADSRPALSFVNSQRRYVTQSKIMFKVASYDEAPSIIDPGGQAGAADEVLSSAEMDQGGDEILANLDMMVLQDILHTACMFSCLPWDLERQVCCKKQCNSVLE